MSGSKSRLAHLVLIAGLCLQTWLLYQPPSAHAEPAHWDKVVHALMFGLPAGLALLLGYRWAPLMLACYAPLSELIQGTSWVGRDADIHDAVADVTGILLVAGLIWFGKWRKVR